MASTDTATTDAPAKRKRASFTRTAKPQYMVVSYTDENGTPVPLRREGLSIKVTKDTDELVALMTAGLGDATLIKVDSPAPAAKAPAA